MIADRQRLLFLKTPFEHFMIDYMDLIGDEVEEGMIRKELGAFAENLTV